MSMMKSLTVGGLTREIPTKTSDLTNDSGFVDAAGAAAAAPVQSVNGKTGDVVLDASDVGLGNVDNVQQYSASNPPPYPVTSVNSKTGAVVLGAADVGAATPADLVAMLPVDTASGPIASFPDGADNVPVEALTVGIAPVQDLHGYANPWPAGGGKQLVNPDTVVVGYISDSSGAIITNANARATDYIPVSPSTDYYILSSKTSGNWGAWYDENKTFVSGISLGASTSGTKQSPASAKYMRFTLSYENNNPDYATNVMIAQSSVAVPYAPYSNICPISGHTQAVVTRTGKNLFDIDGQKSDYGSGLYLYTVSGLKPSTYYTCSSDIAQASPANIYFGGGNTATNGVYNGAPKTFQTDANGNIALYIRFYPVGAENDVYTKIKNGTNWMQIEEGSTATAYSPYTAQTVTIDLDGTRYGGSLDVLTGVLTVTHTVFDLGNISWTHHSPSGSVVYDYFQADLKNDGVKSHSGSGVKADILCSMYPVVTSNEVAKSGFDNCISQSGFIFFIADSTYTDSATFTTAVTGQTLWVELATHQTIQLDANTLATLLGSNNVWTSTNGDTSVTYRANIQKYIQKLVGA